jgi:hypothetical protein
MGNIMQNMYYFLLCRHEHDMAWNGSLICQEGASSCDKKIVFVVKLLTVTTQCDTCAAATRISDVNAMLTGT